MNGIPFGHLLGTGIFLAAFSAAMSTASSQLLACSSMFVGDIFLKLYKKEVSQKTVVLLGRIMTVLFVIISTFLEYISLIYLKQQLTLLHQAMHNYFLLYLLDFSGKEQIEKELYLEH